MGISGHGKDDICFRKCGARTGTLPERGVNTYKDDEVGTGPMGLACRGLQLAFKLVWYLPVFAEYIVQYFILFLLDQQRYVTVVFFVYLTAEFMGKG
jgi:hypothetical protein